VTGGPQWQPIGENELISELETDGDDFFSSGRQNNITDLSLTCLTVVASLGATVLAAADPSAISKWMLAAVAAIPAAAASLQRITAVRERANWYFIYAAKVRALAKQLRYASAPNLEDFAKRSGAIDEEMEADWQKIGHVAPTRREGTRGHG
jgi:hypothetical protein